MITNKIIDILTKIISIITLPVQYIFALLFKVIISLTFKLIFYPINFLWFVLFYGPLIGLSFIYEKVYLLRIPVSILGILVATIGYEFTCFFTYDDMNKRAERLLTCLIFPYSWHLREFTKCNFSIKFSNCYNSLIKYLNKKDFSRDQPAVDLIIKLKVKYESRNGLIY